MTSTPGRLSRLAAHVMHLDSPAYGDERERAVCMESNSFGLTIGIYLGLTLAIITSVFGLLFVPPLILAMTIIPSAAARWYSLARGVDTRKMADAAGDRSTTVTIIAFGSAMALTFAALAFTIFTGTSIVPTPSIEVTPGEGFFGGMVQGAAIGGVLGGLGAIIGGLVSNRRARTRAAEVG